MFIQKVSNLSRFVMTALVVILTAGVMSAQNVTIKGTVTDSNGEPVIGAGVLVKGTTVGAATDVDGKFVLTAPANSTLRVTALNYQEAEVAVNGRASIDVVLKEQNLTLDEAVVTAEFGMKRVARSVGSAVQNVKATDIQEAGRESFVTALQGRVSGMTVASTTGAPGASTQVILRSITSISGSNQPLYVVDGVPINNSTFYTIDNMPNADDINLSPVYQDYSTRGNDINPEDIESMTVLKGAAAAALYGSDASNGAIIITTKKGSSGKGKVSYSNSFRWEKAYGWPEQQLVYANGAYGTTNYYNTAMFGGIYPKDLPLYDNVQAILQTGFSQTHNLSVEGGTDKIMVRGAAGYTDTKGVVKTSDYKRLNISLSGKAEITKWLNFEASMTYTNTGNNKVQKYTSSPLYRAYRWPTVDNMLEYMDPDGIQMKLPQYYIDTDLLNPLYGMYKNKNYDETDRMQVSASLNVTPTKHTYARVTMGWDVGMQTYEYFVHPYYGNRTSASYGDGTFSTTDANFKYKTLNAIAGYNNDWGKFTFSAQFGYHQIDNYDESSSIYATEFLVKNFYGLANCTPSTIQIATRHRTRRIQALSGQLEFGWNNMIYLTARARNDWSSTLPKNNNSYFYPSVELSFVATELPFMKNLDAISYLKLRGAYATVGKDATPLSIYPALESTGMTGGGFNYGYTGPNEGLKPEMTTSWEVGFEGRFANDRINADFTWYKTICKDQYVTGFRLSYATGFVLNNMNVGTFETKGWEAHIDGDIFRGAFNWNLGVNLDHNSSICTYLPDNVSEYYNAYTWVVGNSRNGIKVGYPITSMTGYIYERNSQGQILINPSTGIPTTTSTWEYMGDRHEKLNMGITTSLSYKGFRLSALISSKFGMSIMNGTKYNMMDRGQSLESVALRDGRAVVFNGVLKNGNEESANPTPNNISVTYKNYGSTTIYTGSVEDWFEKDVNFLRLSELRLSYNVPAKWLHNATRKFVNSANIWVKATDLLTITNYSGIDPVGNSASASLGGYGGIGIDYWGLPSPRGYSFGVSLTF